LAFTYIFNIDYCNSLIDLENTSLDECVKLLYINIEYELKSFIRPFGTFISY